MIIPIRCFTCGKVLANKWEDYVEKIEENEKQPKNTPPATTPHHHNFAPDFKGKILDDLGIVKQCCRRHFLGHANIIDII